MKNKWQWIWIFLKVKKCWASSFCSHFCIKEKIIVEKYKEVHFRNILLGFSTEKWHSVWFTKHSTNSSSALGKLCSERWHLTQNCCVLVIYFLLLHCFMYIFIILCFTVVCCSELPDGERCSKFNNTKNQNRSGPH